MHITIRTTNATTRTLQEVELDLSQSLALAQRPAITRVEAAQPVEPQPKQPRFVGLGHDYQPSSEIATAPYVLDNRTGLIWARTLIQHGSPKRLDHAAASEAVKELGEGWRLPTRAELLTLVDDTRHDPAIDTEAFPDTPSDWFWTSTPAAWNPSSVAWFVYFDLGLAHAGLRGLDAFVRAVRSASPAGQ
jgi:hypothetical protein